MRRADIENAMEKMNIESVKRLCFELAGFDSIKSRSLEMRVWRGWSFSQIGRELGMSPTGAKKNYDLMIDRLRQHIYLFDCLETFYETDKNDRVEIEKLPISKKLKTASKGKRYLHELSSITEEQFGNKPNCGATTIAEANKFLSKFGLSFKKPA